MWHREEAAIRRVTRGEYRLGWPVCGPSTDNSRARPVELIDSAGLQTLERIHRSATGPGDRLSFRNGQHVVQRPLGLTRAAQFGSEWAPRYARLGDEDSYLALAMACADVDRPLSGDRPTAA